jgi:hypothetical protein
MVAFSVFVEPKKSKIQFLPQKIDFNPQQQLMKLFSRKNPQTNLILAARSFFICFSQKTKIKQTSQFFVTMLERRTIFS